MCIRKDSENVFYSIFKLIKIVSLSFKLRNFYYYLLAYKYVCMHILMYSLNALKILINKNICYNSQIIYFCQNLKIKKMS